MASSNLRPIVTIAVVMALALSPPMRATAGASPYLQAALDAARWIRSSAIKTEAGTVWPADPRDPKTISMDLYGGLPGIVLFFLDVYRSTGNQEFLKNATAGADYLLANFSSEKESGFYEGVAGIGFALEEVFKATRQDQYRQGAVNCLRLLRGRAIKTGRGVQWNDTTDIISGGSGIGLFLLYAAKELPDPEARDLAVLAGRRLVELGRPEASGSKWAMDPTFPRLMPNFSHGAAGVSYFLATLFAETKDKEFLDAALAGARYLKAVAKTDGDVCLIFHNEPEGKDLYYLGWCHGPVGTARLFYRLFQITGDRAWMDWVKKSARALLTSGIPEKQTPGFWNNVGQCCGSAGVAEFALNMYRVTGERQYFDFATRLTADLLSRATREPSGLKWIQAEHRIKPDLLVAQTGYMQGAAGIGSWLLHLDDFQSGKKPGIVWPDSPF
ncbi:MAG TPA: lanthionine synthetase LanC family protein [Blastocatellia bacterium]|nr:lanthionine synthetase LanC family protein [Blastocatellia bacterium]